MRILHQQQIKINELQEETKKLKEALTTAINNILALQGITKDSPEYEYRFLATWNDYMEQAKENLK